MCAGFRVLEAGAGTGGLTKDALPMFETDMHHELLRYCATDITSAFSAGLIDAVRSPKLLFKVPTLYTLPTWPDEAESAIFLFFHRTEAPTHPSDFPW